MNLLFSRIRQARGKETEEQTFEVVDYTIPGATDYQIDIALTRTDFKQGYITLYIPNIPGIAILLRRRTSFITFTTDRNNSLAQSSAEGSIVVSICVYKYNYAKGYYFDNDNKLSDNYFGYGGQIYIKSCEIVGNKVELIFRNNHGIISGKLNVKGVCFVWR